MFYISEISRFIAAGRLNCTIDKVTGIVETNHAELRNIEYLTILKQGENLSARVQKLGRLLS